MTQVPYYHVPRGLAKFITNSSVQCTTTLQTIPTARAMCTYLLNVRHHGINFVSYIRDLKQLNPAKVLFLVANSVPNLPSTLPSSPMIQVRHKQQWYLFLV